MKFRVVMLMTAISLMPAGCASNGRHFTDEQLQKQAEIHFELGIDALNKGLLPKAFDELIQADNIQPNQPKVLDALAYAWRLRGDLEKAEKYYQKALRAGSRAATHNNYANLLVQMKRYKQAERHARKALEDPRYPNQHLAFLNLGDALLGQGKFNDAIIAYQQAAKLRPNDLLPPLKEATAYLQYDRPNYSRAILEDLRRKFPDNRMVTEKLVELLKQQHDLPAARAVLQSFQARSKSPLDRAWASDELMLLGP